MATDAARDTTKDAPPTEAPDVNPDAEAEVTAENSFRNNPERIQEWISYCRSNGKDREADKWQEFLTDLQTQRAQQA